MELEAGGVERFAAAWSVFDEELDWALLGRLHCHEGGDDFFGAEDRAALLETGLFFADDLSGSLARGGRSLWVGASVAESVPILVEHLCLGREVLWHDLVGPLTAELERALRAAEARLDVPLPHVSTAGLGDVAPGSCDHLWLVSVLSDPEHFPALHDRLYARSDVAPVGGGDLPGERRRALALAASALRALRPPGRLTTSDEELPLVREACTARGWRLEVPPQGRVSAVVGDVVRACRIEVA